MKNLIMIFTLACLSHLTTHAAEKEIVGTWKFKVNDAPYAYQQGEALFYKTDKDLLVKLVFEYSELKDIKVVCSDDTYSFNVEVEYEQVLVKLQFEDGKLVGKAETYEGNMPIVMEPESKKQQ